MPETQSKNGKINSGWQFWIDRGGTFTDFVAQSPDGKLKIHKLLSENPDRYEDAVIQGIRELLGVADDTAIPEGVIDTVKMGTTVATNALLEHKGCRTVLVISKGFCDALQIGYQNRPHLFARHIVLPKLLYERVIEVEERLSADGSVLINPNLKDARKDLEAAFEDGIESVAIVFMHGYRHHIHEIAVAELARKIGFRQVSVSHEVSPLMKFVSRGDTTVVDAYISPILRRYVDLISSNLGKARLMFMQSNGGLTDARYFRGKDSILSGPAGGIVGAVRTATKAGYDKIISFDMGGTSTDVAHFFGKYERTFETLVAGVRMRSPMMKIETVAAGGGSILHFDGTRYQVGPDSTGANPGPACYRRGGELCVTDANVMVGKIRAEFFPHVFGVNGNEPLDETVVYEKFSSLVTEIERETGDKRTPVEAAEGFLMIAVENMAKAIKKISIQRGHDITEYTLNSFGGAGGQHACLVADALGITRVFIHPFAGVLSAYGMGLADLLVIRERAIEATLNETIVVELKKIFEEIELDGREEMKRQGGKDNRTTVHHKVHLRYEGTDSALIVNFAKLTTMVKEFEEIHHQQYGFIAPEKNHIVEAINVEVISYGTKVADPELEIGLIDPPVPISEVETYMAGKLHHTKVYDRETIRPGCRIVGPAIIKEAIATTILEPGWGAEVNNRNQLILNRVEARTNLTSISTKADPVMLEVFNNLFMSIAEQMGVVLRNTSYSVNIKERLDFSCAIFDADSSLVANAPHIPVHLGSMSESVKTIVDQRSNTIIAPGDVFMLNTPYNGGTHLPDVTIITPVFGEDSENILFYVASRGHHAEIGGITPGSVPPNSTHIDEEGVLIDNFQIVAGGRLLEAETEKLFTNAPYPTRNFQQNLADIKAHIAANEKGVQELHKMIRHFGLDVVQAYMKHIQDNAEECVRRVLYLLTDGSYEYEMDSGAKICVDIKVDHEAREAIIDFTGTAPQQNSNFNAPSSVCMAAVLYVFRLMIDYDIPLNAGCLKPLKIIIPKDCMLAPKYPAAVVAGNVETSQAVTNALIGALGFMAAGQGTMNNFTFGNNAGYQYYETICGGSGAGPDYKGTNAIHTHMTNTLATDPEILEWRFPVVLESFTIRQGSGGAGKHPGGHGAIRRLRFEETMNAAVVSSHRRVPPFGMAGGEPGICGHNYVERADGKIDELTGTDSTVMNPGDVFIIETPGGGGYGKV